MAWRVTQEEVRATIDNNTTLSLASFIDTATAVTDYVSSQDSDSVLTTALLKEIERYLAAYYYEFRDQAFSDKKTGDAGAKFQGEFGMGFDSNKWGQAAMRIDASGTLRKMNKGSAKAKSVWLGLPPSSQTDYVDRD